jgi:hypothetical protein
VPWSAGATPRARACSTARPGDAADRFGLQALRLCHRAGSGLALRRHDPRRAADHRRARVGALFADELLQRVLWRGDADRGAGAVAQHPRRAPVRGRGPRPRAHRGLGVRDRKRSGRRSGAGAGRVGIDAAGDDRRLFRHPERRLGGAALRPAGGALSSATTRPSGAAHGPSGSRDLGGCRGS